MRKSKECPSCQQEMRVVARLARTSIVYACRCAVVKVHPNLCEILGTQLARDIGSELVRHWLSYDVDEFKEAMIKAIDKDGTLGETLRKEAMLREILDDIQAVEPGDEDPDEDEFSERDIKELERMMKLR